MLLDFQQQMAYAFTFNNQFCRCALCQRDICPPTFDDFNEYLCDYVVFGICKCLVTHLQMSRMLLSVSESFSSLGASVKIGFVTIVKCRMANVTSHLHFGKRRITFSSCSMFFNIIIITTSPPHYRNFRNWGETT